MSANPGPHAIAADTAAQELKIFGSRVTKVMVGELEAEFVRRTGRKPVVTADVSAVMMRRIEQD